MKQPAQTPSKAPAKKTSANKEQASMMFADGLKAKMLDEEKAHLRDVKVDGNIVVYEFSNGEQITVDRQKIDAAGDYEAVQKYVAECFAARKPT